ncbi:plasmid segregation protein ParM (plasmid) [Salmonella enterica]|nr:MULTISPECIES: plasmid segregation protein ParM domain-containing protein [Enterobacteriaceae]MDI2628192.1 plasmid segregation protein ParM [Salmonella enterica]WFQ54088.1 plasmid segregation protein ParM [Salmonella enterica]WFQ68291.1 plasmid segregation protein ParM [Salmonella enterica]
MAELLKSESPVSQSLQDITEALKIVVDDGSKAAKLVCLKEGANKQVISSQADSLIKISRIWADFFPANTSNQPI